MRHDADQLYANFHAFNRSFDDRVLFGSDFRHAEGLAEPRDFVESIRRVPPDVRKIMRDNLRDLLGGVRAPARA